MAVPIQKLGDDLIVTLQASLTDAELELLRVEILARAGRSRVRGVLLDVTALDVMDSFAARMLVRIAHAGRLRGADVVIVGIQPDVAFAMVQLGVGLEDIETELDVEEGLASLAARRVLRRDGLRP